MFTFLAIHYALFSAIDLLTFSQFLQRKINEDTIKLNEMKFDIFVQQCFKFIFYCQLIVPTKKFCISFPIGAGVFTFVCLTIQFLLPGANFYQSQIYLWLKLIFVVIW